MRERIMPYGGVTGDSIKRVFDMTLVVLTAVVWVPLLLLAMAVVWAALGRPVFFVQERAGLDGRPFRLVKLRTMREGDGADAERLTRFGRWLRSTSLDELPELWHVLTGEMSLVGPRPLPTRYLSRYSQEQARRHEVRPGITGWAQVNGRNTLTWEQKFEHDVWYVDNHSFWLDLQILWRTIWLVLARHGIQAEGEATMGELLRPPSGRNDECKNGRPPSGRNEESKK
jgi:lipopolysaccharide/colanic/teichoic acid biosynthesis glycosyltransferase